MPSENNTFTTHVDPGSPPLVQAGSRCPRGVWWRRRVLPPGPQRLFRKAFIAIVGCPTR